MIKSTDRAGSTLLHHAAAFGTLDTMTVLLDAGADVNAKNRRRSTPLHWAVHDEARVRLLLARGAAVNAKNVEGLSNAGGDIDEACENCHTTFWYPNEKKPK